MVTGFKVLSSWEMTGRHDGGITKSPVQNIHVHNLQNVTVPNDSYAHTTWHAVHE